ncbi:hypothetical protein GA0115251_10889 [Streptomyces sp. TverLS-915]|uniref:hypothetical protein n=1 Tax=Streptomyces sp. TverLS-915 TaxID=1839763 RepID=UPI00081E8BDE|nr:hypothetical protein [Streptomyces sp. TverLS-915]SCD46882.1 hypothetical protein GA0115251_10889 [Streptomyces sp. TverLS-915]
MPQHVSVMQQVGVAALVTAAVAWAVGLARGARGDRGVRGTEPAVPRAATIPASAGTRRPRIPRQSVPASESVELTPAERAAFAGLVRRLEERG